ncbi:predicted protein [Chaetomium globosum CBS 148.51]|uniref:Uncharacterized protein n=1 Tax=Chaetomium globosum (strain ATCC 6205 / CBS 148.51 / DSM 1962 / NBRC 6347 / NRRL 1970) TaxID=306901 RepID=Q2H498_CHAGB|nr:uncharacterized protein CHGG_06517 [Chaetomium globosum CBS 148.51]EAQ89898.1 predicted protein [Chaetomium globosum CBS 148.51]
MPGVATELVTAGFPAEHEANVLLNSPSRCFRKDSASS